MFQFINNYFVLLYIAYIRPILIPCTDDFCSASNLSEIQFQLIIVFTGKTVGWRLKEVLRG